MIEACDKPVTVLTDHAATTGIVRQTSLHSSSVDKLNNRLTRASQYLSSFHNLKVVYRLGREHVVPDALSRLMAESEPVEEDDDVLDDLLMAFQTTSVEIEPKFRAELLY